MNLRHSFSRLKKKVKHVWNKRKLDGAGVGPANPLPGPGPHIVAGNGEGNGADIVGRQDYSTDRSLQSVEPEPVLAGGSEDCKGGGGMDVNGGEVDRRDSLQRSDVGSGPGRGGVDVDEDERFYSCSSAPSTPGSREPDGA